jgi:probable rRNA maturation factor
MPSPEGSTVTFRRVSPTLKRRGIQNFAHELQRVLTKGKPFDTLIAGDAELQRLNRQFRGKDYPTDVLSFPAPPAIAATLGDLAISAPRARAQARAYRHPVETEIRILMLHGVLHLLGYDHESDNGRMSRAEKRWRTRLNLPASLIERADLGGVSALRR